MEHALIVSGTRQGTEFCTEMLARAQVCTVTCAATAGSARRLLLENNYDICIINTPLPDESGGELACKISEENGCQVLMLVKAELYEAVAENVEQNGVIVLSKPINRALFWSAIKLAQAAQARMQRIENQNKKLLQKIEDIKVIDRAKCVLVGYLNMSEVQAHRYIEKHAMDLRQTKREVAEDVLKTYDNINL